MFSDLEALTHPRKEMCQRVVSSLDALWNTGAPTRERQRANTIRPDNHIGIYLGEASLRRKDISRTFFGAAAHDLARSKEL